MILSIFIKKVSLKKMKKRNNYLLLGVLLLSLATGCGETKKKEKLVEETPKTQGKCEVRECITLLNTKNTTEEINEIIGFEGEKSEYSNKYTWKLSDKESITLDMSSTSPILQATIDKEKVKNENNDFSVFNELKEDLNKGKSITYKEMVEKLGGIEGTLAGRTSTSDRYIWVDKHDRTFSATFNNTKDGKCSIISLR